MTPSELRALAFKLADENAIVTVHSNCAPADAWDDSAGESAYHRAWFLPGRNDEGRADVLEAIRYGEARGFFARNRRRGIVAFTR